MLSEHSPDKVVEFSDYSPDKEVELTDPSPDKEVELRDHSPNKDVELDKQELDAMSSRQQTALKNIDKNYETMLDEGKPDFMKEHVSSGEQAEENKHGSTELIKEMESSLDSDVDGTCSLDSDGNERSQEEKISSSFLTPNKRKTEHADPAVKEIKCQRKMDDKVLENNVHNLIDRKTTNVMQLEAPGDDNFLYCEECNKEYDVDCPIHGPLDHITDTEICSEYDPERALHTLPPGLTVNESSIGGAGLGVFTEKEIPPRVMFGPYGGVKILDETAHDSGYCWQICANGKPSHFVDAKEEAISNWMRYVNCATSESEQNLAAFQLKGSIYYRSCKTIDPGTELLCWYGNEYGRELGLVKDKKLQIRSTMVNGKDCYPCLFCKTSFTTAVHKARHMMRMHARDKLTQSDIQELDEWLRKNDWEEYTRQRQKKSWQVQVDKHKDSGIQPDKITEQVKVTEQNTSENDSDSTVTYIQDSDKMLTKEEGIMFRCGVCDCDFTTENDLNRHMRMRNHNDENCFKCNACDYVCSQSSVLKRHMRIHTGDKCFKCDFCDYTFSDNSNLRVHMRIHTGEKSFKCDVCDFACIQSSGLKRHMRIHTGEKYKCFKCDVCDYATSRKHYLKIHMGIHTGEKNYKCDFCDYATNVSYTLKSHMSIHTGEKRYKCDLCDYASAWSSHLKRHVRRHTGENLFKCDVCDYVSIYRHHLKMHKGIHTGAKSYKCDVCDYACHASSNLTTHMRIHTGEKCFKCYFCDYACNGSSNLKTHMRTHTGEKSFKCDFCDYASVQSSALKRHMRRHTGEKCFKCDICGYTCNQNSALKIHLKKHTGDKCFKCDFCEYACYRNDVLKTHMSIHTGEKCFKCDICDYASNQSCHLKRHMATHAPTGEKSFKCGVCGHVSRYNHLLKRHMKKHTKEKLC